MSLITKNHGFDKYANCVWWTVVTMTTIGFGDFYPKTTPGRIMTFILSIWGVIIVSLMVVALSTFVTTSNSQNKTFSMIKKL